MNQYNISSKLQTVLLVGIVIGVLSLGCTWLCDDELHSRFWSNLLHNSVFFTGIALMATFFMAVSITAWAGWYTTFKRVWESFASFLLVGLGLMTFIGIAVYMHWNHLYHWADTAAVADDKILTGKKGFLNSNVYLFGTLIVVGLWYFIYRKIRGLSLAEDEGGDEGFTHHRKMRFWAAIFLPIAGFTSAAMIWQWIMSIDAHWYSTMFAWYTGASWFVAMICLTILTLLYLKSKGYYEKVTTEHMHDLGKLLFAFSIFWTYLWFSQYMLIWYANNGEETVYFHTRQTEYPVLFYGNLLVNFVLPFFVLMRNDTKRKFGSLGIIAGIVLMGHWWDFFQMIKPGVVHTTHEVLNSGEHGAAHVAGFMAGFSLPGFLEIGTFIGFLCGFFWVVARTLSSADLIPKNDPYLAESLHHHV